jgi:hypothetical protein
MGLAPSDIGHAWPREFQKPYQNRLPKFLVLIAGTTQFSEFKNQVILEQMILGGWVTSSGATSVRGR